MPGKADGAFRTIGEVSRDTGVPAHVLRYWETRFPQLRPVVRAGQRRYYRPDDVALVRRIDALLNGHGYTIRGVQKLLEEGDDTPVPTARPFPAIQPFPTVQPVPTIPPGPPAAPPSDLPAVDPAVLDAVRRIRDALAAALADD